MRGVAWGGRGNGKEDGGSVPLPSLSLSERGHERTDQFAGGAVVAKGEGRACKRDADVVRARSRRGLGAASTSTSTSTSTSATSHRGVLVGGCESAAEPEDAHPERPHLVASVARRWEDEGRGGAVLVPLARGCEEFGLGGGG